MHVCKMMTLQDLCLQRIVEKFDGYYLAFHSTSEDINIKRQLEFLQRKYSYQIATRLFFEDELQEKYIDLLVNKYVKVLDTDWFKHCSWEKVTSKFAEIGCYLQKVTFQYLSFDDSVEMTPWQDVICYLSSLEVLSLHCDCNDDIVKNIARYCPNIVEIDFRNSGITNESIKFLCTAENGKSSCTKLRKLLITSSAVKDDGMKHLIKNLPSLEYTDYRELPQVLYSIHKNDLSSLDKVQTYNLVSLDLLNFALAPFFNDLLKVCLSVCPRLKSLTCPLLNDEHLNSFSTLADLEKLHLECYSNSEIDINNLLKSKGSKLTSLSVLNCSVSVPSLAGSCPLLKQLCLNRGSFMCDYESKPIFHCLTSCTFEAASDDPSTAKAVSFLLSCSPKLESISFKRCTLLSSEIKSHILRCCERCSINKISFCCSVVELEFIKDVLLNCHSLKSINLEGCDLPNDDEDELYNIAQILPNNPHVYFNEELSTNSEYDNILNDFFEFDDLIDDYDNYEADDDFYLDYPSGDDDDYDDYDEYNVFFEI